MSKFIACSFWINSLKKLRKKLGNQNKQTKWLNNVLNEEVPFSGPKSAKTRPKFFSQKTPQFPSKAPQFGNFLVENDSPYQFLLHFYVIIFSKYPKSNISQRFFNTFRKIFLDSSKRPKFIWRHNHKEFQKCHSDAKAPLLAF